MLVVMKPDKRRSFVLKSQIYMLAANLSGPVLGRACRLNGCFQFKIVTQPSSGLLIFLAKHYRPRLSGSFHK